MARFSDTGDYLALARIDDSIHVYSLETGELVRRGQHTGPITAIEFSRDSRHLASSSDDGTARLYSVESSGEIARLSHTGSVSALSISLKGDRLITASEDRIPRFWQIEPSPVGAALTNPPNCMPLGGQTNALAFASDGNHFATALTSGVVTLFMNRNGFRFEAPLPKPGPLLLHRSPILRMTFSPNNVHLCTLSADRTVSLWQIGTGILAGSILPENEVLSFCMAPDGRWLATGSSDSMSLWDASPALETVQLLHDSEVTQLSCSSLGEFIVACGTDRANVWSANLGNMVNSISLPQAANAIAFNSTGDLLLSVVQKSIRMDDLHTRAQVTIQPCPEPILAAAFGPGNQIYALSNVWGWKLWRIDRDLSTPRWEATDLPLEGFIVSAFSVDGKWIAAFGQKRILVFDSDGSLPPETVSLPDATRILTVSSHRKYVATANLSTAWVLNVKDCKVVNEIRMPTPINALAFSPDGKYLLVAAGKTITRHTVVDADLIAAVSLRVDRELTSAEIERYSKMELS
jgi:WD40 repeat protein